MNVTKQVAGRPENLKVGDELVWPNGDRWVVFQASDAQPMGHGDTRYAKCLDTGDDHLWYTLESLRSILSAVQVERKPESVTTEVMPCHYVSTTNNMVLVPGDWPLGTKVEVKAVEP